MRPGGLCQLDRLESPAAVKVYRQRELYATLERPEFLELNEGYIALRAIQYTDPDGDWAVTGGAPSSNRSFRSVAFGHSRALFDRQRNRRHPLVLDA